MFYSLDKLKPKTKTKNQVFLSLTFWLFYTLWIEKTWKLFFWFLVFSFSFWFQFIQRIEQISLFFGDIQITISFWDFPTFTCSNFLCKWVRNTCHSNLSCLSIYLEIDNVVLKVSKLQKHFFLKLHCPKTNEIFDKILS